MTYHARLKRLETLIVPQGDSCATCGFPDHQANHVTIYEDGEGMGECEACGRTLAPDGRPLAAGTIKVLVLTKSLPLPAGGG